MASNTEQFAAGFLGSISQNIAQRQQRIQQQEAFEQRRGAERENIRFRIAEQEAADQRVRDRTRQEGVDYFNAQTPEDQQFLINQMGTKENVFLAGPRVAGTLLTPSGRINARIQTLRQQQQGQVLDKLDALAAGSGQTTPVLADDTTVQTVPTGEGEGPPPLLAEAPSVPAVPRGAATQAATGFLSSFPQAATAGQFNLIEQGIISNLFGFNPVQMQTQQLQFRKTQLDLQDLETKREIQQRIRLGQPVTAGERVFATGVSEDDLSFEKKKRELELTKLRVSIRQLNNAIKSDDLNEEAKIEVQELVAESRDIDLNTDQGRRKAEEIDRKLTAVLNKNLTGKQLKDNETKQTLSEAKEFDGIYEGYFREFQAGLTEDLPLPAIVSFAELTLTDLDDPDDARLLLDWVATAIRRLKRDGVSSRGIARILRNKLDFHIERGLKNATLFQTGDSQKEATQTLQQAKTIIADLEK